MHNDRPLPRPSRRPRSRTDRRRLPATHLAGLLAITLAACGGQDAETTGSGGSMPSPDEAIGKVGADGIKPVAITGNDQMQYNVNAFEVPTDARVRIEFTNVGELPKAAMGHNVVVLKNGVDPLEFATAAAEHPQNNYIPPDRQNDILAHTRLLGPGENDTIEFAAPATGDYTYLCSFPGHFQAGMKGTMTVTEP